MRNVPFFAWLVLVAATAIACSKSDSQKKVELPETPELAVKAFYDWRISSQMTGAPTQAQLETMSPWVSAELRGLLVKAREMHDRDVARAPDEKPEFADGDLFTSLFEGPTSFTTGDAEVNGPDVHVVPVRFVSARQLPAVNWVDHVTVVRENGAYVIADVAYGNHWDFGNKGTLRKALKKAVSG